MEGNNELRESSQAVQSHLSMTQAVIQRMATNSASCKAWCITLVSAILVIVADKGVSNYAFIAIIPTSLFLALDAYYLALERAFRNSYNRFIEKLEKGAVVASDLYVVSPQGHLFSIFLQSLCSFSIWPFYLTLALMIWIAKILVI